MQAQHMHSPACTACAARLAQSADTQHHCCSRRPEARCHPGLWIVGLLVCLQGGPACCVWACSVRHAQSSVQLHSYGCYSCGPMLSTAASDLRHCIPHTAAGAWLVQLGNTLQIHPCPSGAAPGLAALSAGARGRAGLWFHPSTPPPAQAAAQPLRPMELLHAYHDLHAVAHFRPERDGGACRGGRAACSLCV